MSNRPGTKIEGGAIEYLDTGGVEIGSHGVVKVILISELPPVAVTRRAVIEHVLDDDAPQGWMHEAIKGVPPILRLQPLPFPGNRERLLVPTVERPAEQASAEIADVMKSLMLVNRVNKELQDALAILYGDKGIPPLSMAHEAFPVRLDIPTVEGDHAGTGHPLVGAEKRECL